MYMYMYKRIFVPSQKLLKMYEAGHQKVSRQKKDDE